jgi:hypothetical protein
MCVCARVAEGERASRRESERESRPPEREEEEERGGRREGESNSTCSKPRLPA